MNSYVALITFTAQGLQNLHESPHRANSFKAAAKKAGVKVTQLFWTLGEYDGAILFEAKDDAAATGLMLLSFLALGCGLILNNVARGQRAMKRLAYLAVTAAGTSMPAPAARVPSVTGAARQPASADTVR